MDFCTFNFCLTLMKIVFFLISMFLCFALVPKCWNRDNTISKCVAFNRNKMRFENRKGCAVLVSEGMRPV